MMVALVEVWMRNRKEDVARHIVNVENVWNGEIS